MAGSVQKTPSGNWVVSYTYANTPKLGLRRGSPPHLGGAALTIFGEPPTRIEGEYWTDRDSKGTLTLIARVPPIAPSYSDAETLFAHVAEPG